MICSYDLLMCQSCLCHQEHAPCCGKQSLGDNLQDLGPMRLVVASDPWVKTCRTMLNLKFCFIYKFVQSISLQKVVRL